MIEDNFKKTTTQDPSHFSF